MLKPQVWRVNLAAKKLLSGEVIAYPTEGVWGLGCLPSSEVAVAKVLSLKSRPWQKGLILVAANIDQVLPYIDELSTADMATLNESWPGPVTYLIKKSAKTPLWISGESDLVAFRVSAHPVVQAVCNRIKGPIVSTSANPAGKAPAINRMQLRRFFGEQIDFVFAGELGGNKGASEIRDLSTGEVLRAAE